MFKIDIKSKYFHRALIENIVFSIISGYVFYRSIIATLIIFIIFFTQIFHKIEELEIKEKLDNTLAFLDFLNILRRLVSSGMALPNALIKSKDELLYLYPDNCSWIVNRVVKISNAIMLQSSVDELFVKWGRDDEIREIMDFGYLLKTVSSYGGDMTKLITDTAKIISQRIETEYQIKSFSESKIYEQKILFALGYVIIILLGKSFPELFNILYSGFIGRLIMTISFIMMVFGKYIGIKIADIKV